MNFLGLFVRFWKRISQDSISPEIEPDERLSRYVLYNRHMKQGRLRPQAFLPAPRTRTTSVYRTKGCSEDMIWQLGDRFVTALHREKRPVIGRGDIPAQVVLDQDLRIVSSPTPHARHADILNWPPEEDLLLMKATELATRAALVRRPS